jgi:hypothetical protein
MGRARLEKLLRFTIPKLIIKLSNRSIEAIKFVKNISLKHRKRFEYDFERQRFKLKKKFRIAA